jgi:hypothetical protein
MKAMFYGFAAAILIALVAGVVLTSINPDGGERMAPPDSVRLS